MRMGQGVVYGVLAVLSAVASGQLEIQQPGDPGAVEGGGGAVFQPTDSGNGGQPAAIEPGGLPPAVDQPIQTPVLETVKGPAFVAVTRNTPMTTRIRQGGIQGECNDSRYGMNGCGGEAAIGAQAMATCKTVRQLLGTLEKFRFNGKVFTAGQLRECNGETATADGALRLQPQEATVKPGVRPQTTLELAKKRSGGSLLGGQGTGSSIQAPVPRVGVAPAVRQPAAPGRGRQDKDEQNERGKNGRDPLALGGLSTPGPGGAPRGAVVLEPGRPAAGGKDSGRSSFGSALRNRGVPATLEGGAGRTVVLETLCDPSKDPAGCAKSKRGGGFTGSRPAGGAVTEGSVFSDRVGDAGVHVDPKKVCIAEVDPWGCKPPIIHGLQIRKEDQAVLDGKRPEYPLGYVMRLSVVVENASRVVVEEDMGKYYSPVTLYTNKGLRPGKRTIRFALTIRQQEPAIVIKAENPHGGNARTEFIKVGVPLLPRVKSAFWTDRNGKVVNRIDSDQEVFLALGGVAMSDVAKLRLVTVPVKCQGSVFYDSGRDRYLWRYNAGFGRNTGLRTLVTLHTCRGTDYEIYAEVDPGLGRSFPTSRKMLSRRLKVKSSLLPKPRFVKVSLGKSVDGAPRPPKGGYYVGDRFRLPLVVMDVDTLKVVNHDGKVLQLVSGLGGGRVDSFFALDADANIASRFDVVAIASDGKLSKETRHRFFPRIVRAARLTVPVHWKTRRPEYRVRISCGLTWKGQNSGGPWAATRTIDLQGRRTGRTTLTFDIEGLVRGGAAPRTAIKYYCSAADANIQGRGMGSMEHPTGHTLASWPVRRVAITTQTFSITGR